MNNIADTIEWIKIAERDFDSAKLLNEAVRRHYEVICYMCAQSAEKYLKGYLVSNEIIPQKSHNLMLFHSLCAEIDNNFAAIATLCDFLNRFANDIRYPHQYEVYETDAIRAINAVEKIRTFQPILNLRELICDDTESAHPNL